MCLWPSDDAVFDNRSSAMAETLEEEIGRKRTSDKGQENERESELPTDLEEGL